MLNGMYRSAFFSNQMHIIVSKIAQCIVILNILFKISKIFYDYFFFLSLVVTSDCGFCQSNGLRRYIGHGGTVINAAITKPAPKI